MSDPARLKPIADAGVIAVVRAPDTASAISGVDALVAGGITGIEITFSTPDAPGVIAELARRHGASILLGAGTVLTADQATAAVDAGARFLVSPGAPPDLLEAMLGTGITVLAGAFTPTEVMSVVARGAHVVKLFPASLGGPGLLRSLRGPFPGIPFVPTGGVDAGNLGDWFAAGALAVGAGGELCSADVLRRGDFDEIRRRAVRFIQALAAVRAP